MRETLARVRVDDGIIEYIADIVGRSRVHRSVYLGASPRASIGLLAVARAPAPRARAASSSSPTT